METSLYPINFDFNFHHFKKLLSKSYVVSEQLGLYIFF